MKLEDFWQVHEHIYVPPLDYCFLLNDLMTVFCLTGMLSEVDLAAQHVVIMLAYINYMVCLYSIYSAH